jgi:hypothetical protein
VGTDPEEGRCVGLTCEERKQLSDCTSRDPTLWRAEAWAAYAQVNDELQRARAHVRCGCGTRWPQAAKAVRRCKMEIAEREIEIAQDDLDAALQAMALPRRPSGARAADADGAGCGSRALRAPKRIWMELKLYYSGARIERTWSAIHRASANLYMLYEESELPAQARRLHALVAALPDLNSQLTSLTEILPELKIKAENARQQVPAGVRPMLRELYQEAMGVTESLQTEARVLRNALLAASGGLLLILLTLGVWHLLNKDIFSLCANAEKRATVCPVGGHSSRPLDVFAIELAGMLGGVLSVVVPIATGERIKTPYRVFNLQLVLKVLTGAAAGLAGVLLIESGIVPALTTTSKAAIIGYAVFFGITQQALTGIIDRRASSLARETPTVKSV